MSGKTVKIGVVLSGCGVYDGAEIHESVLTLLAISRHGAEAVCYAPNIPQHHVINHLTGVETGETRNVLVESARIARGSIHDLAQFDVAEVDALVFPGGFGAAKNLSSFAFEGAGCTVNPQVAAAINAMVAAGKPVGAGGGGVTDHRPGCRHRRRPGSLGRPPQKIPSGRGGGGPGKADRDHALLHARVDRGADCRWSG